MACDSDDDNMTGFAELTNDSSSHGYPRGGSRRGGGGAKAGGLRDDDDDDEDFLENSDIDWGEFTVAYNNSNNIYNYKVSSCTSNNNNNHYLCNKATTSDGFSIGGSKRQQQRYLSAAASGICRANDLDCSAISETDQQALQQSQLRLSAASGSPTVADISSHLTDDSFSFSFISALLGLH